MYYHSHIFRKCFSGSTKVEFIFYCPNKSYYTYEELDILIGVLLSFTGASYPDIIVSELKWGCVHVTFMIRNNHIFKLKLLFQHENRSKTLEKMSHALKHKIKKVVIQDHEVYQSGMCFIDIKHQVRSFYLMPYLVRYCCRLIYVETTKNPN